MSRSQSKPSSRTDQGIAHDFLGARSIAATASNFGPHGRLHRMTRRTQCATSDIPRRFATYCTPSGKQFPGRTNDNDVVTTRQPTILANTIGNLVADGIAGNGRGRSGGAQTGAGDGTLERPVGGVGGGGQVGAGEGASEDANVIVVTATRGRNSLGNADYSSNFMIPPIIFDRGSGGQEIATGSTALQHPAFADDIQIRFQSGAAELRRQRLLTGTDLMGLANQALGEDRWVWDEGWDGLAQAYNAGRPGTFDMTLRDTQVNSVSLLSQLDGQLMTSTAGAFIWGEVNTGSFGIAGAFDTTGAVQAAADQHPYAQYAGVGAGILVGGVGGFGRAGATAEGSVLQKTGRFFYDPGPFRTISREYWNLNGPANGASLHHWLFPQRVTFVSAGIKNAGFNLIKLPAMRGVFHETLGLNQWMGFARNWGPAAARNAAIVENSIRVGIPTATGGAAYGAYEIADRLWNEK